MYVTNTIIKDDMGFDRFKYFVVWADEGNEKLIESVEGVVHAFVDVTPTRYNVFVLIKQF